VVAVLNAAAVAEAPQLDLAGIAPAPATRTARLVVDGQLERQAEVRVSPDGRTHLIVQVLQPRRGLPFVAMWHAKSPADAGDLRHYAPLLRAGAPITVIGCGLVLGLCDDGHDALLFQRCDAVQVHGIATFAHPQDPSE
jgi:hypothetical protein